jgi:hypothetical protein
MWRTFSPNIKVRHPVEDLHKRRPPKNEGFISIFVLIGLEL